MRKSRYQKGSVKKPRGRWVAMWWIDGSRKSRVVGLVKEMSKSEARAEVDRIVREVNAKQNERRVWQFGEFVADVYFPYYSRKWKGSTRANNVNRVTVHLVANFKDRELRHSGATNCKICSTPKPKRCRFRSSIICGGI